MLIWTEDRNEAIMRHALQTEKTDNIYTWRSLLQSRPELSGDCTSKQLRERAAQIAKSLIDVRFKHKYKKELQ